MTEKMKRYISFITAAVILVLAMAVGSFAMAATATLVPEAGEAVSGSTWEIAVKAEGENVRGLRVDFESSGLALDSIAAEGNTRPIVSSGSRVLVYANSDEDSIQSGDILFRLSFFVPEDTADGTKVAVVLKNIVFSDGKDDFYGENVTVTAIVSKPVSDDATLSGIVLNGKEIEDFDPETKEYSVRVPYETETAQIIIETNHTMAVADVISPEKLEVGENTVRIIITAESGDTEEYLLFITREEEEKTYPENEAGIYGIISSAGTLSPTFSREIDSYVIYVPFETTELELSAEPVSPDAVCTKIIMNPDEGANEAQIVCTAADGVTEESYHVIVYRLPEYSGELPLITKVPEATPEPTPEPTPGPTPDEGEEHGHSDNFFEFLKETTVGFNLLTLCIIFVLIIVLLILMVAFFIVSSKRRANSPENKGEEVK